MISTKAPPHPLLASTFEIGRYTFTAEEQITMVLWPGKINTVLSRRNKNKTLGTKLQKQIGVWVRVSVRKK